MKALVMTEYKKFAIQQIEKPVCGDDEVLVKIEACGICGSDVHGMDGSTGRRQPPMIMGHEASGVISEVGKNVSGFASGERVTFDSTIYCANCKYCHSGDINLCENRRVVGVSCDEYKSQGAFAEYLALPPRILYKFGKNLDFEKACMVEPLSIAFHAVNITDIKLGDTVVVVGTGVIGQMVVQAVRLAGAGKLIAVDLDDDRLAKSVKHGADKGLNSSKCNVIEEVKTFTNGRMADVVIEAVGADATINMGIDCLKKGGAMTIIGNISPTISLPLQKLVTRELKIQGSCASAGEYPACLEFLERGVIDVSDAISVVAPMEDGQKMFERLYSREAGLNKIILKPNA
jgi:L-iditol 2-dehydrogenase